MLFFIGTFFLSALTELVDMCYNTTINQRTYYK